MGLGLKVHVGHVLGLEHDLGLGVDPSYKPCWDHITTASSRSKKEYILSNGNGMYWECSIRWAVRSCIECYLGCGWKRFVTKNKLCAGDCIKLEVDKNEDSLITVKKI